MARYAGIEGGDECERWLPLLSAIVDGEATPDQLMDVRPHLRNCTACRATVRELHTGPSYLKIGMCA
jgi:anti-sigma factor RsiW